MSAGEAVIRKRAAAASDQGKNYVEYLRREDVVDLLADLDDARLRAGLVAVPEGANVIVRDQGEGVEDFVASDVQPISVTMLGGSVPVHLEDDAVLLGDDPGWMNDPVRGDSEPTVWRPRVPATPPPEGFKALYVTFGQRYVREPHESGLSWPHPHGFLTVHYRDADEVANVYVSPFDGLRAPRDAHERARQTVMAYLGGHFATSYAQEPTEFVPWGELALMVLP